MSSSSFQKIPQVKSPGARGHRPVPTGGSEVPGTHLGTVLVQRKPHVLKQECEFTLVLKSGSRTGNGRLHTQQMPTAGFVNYLKSRTRRAVPKNTPAATGGTCLAESRTPGQSHPHWGHTQWWRHLPQPTSRPSVKHGIVGVMALWGGQEQACAPWLYHA